ncbi:hypothetical protein CKN99_10160 [Carnobacterium maltaromaticum]|uniref:hypothetical protein n=1 Tax=Carnobacterium maltaromaticum TaxID=2751 RepID=UPI000704C88D|nr:hypothetical protein [Carnobacterium maltaromaticum]KRN85313.1 hypothetical protein IV75_GL002807 [Carnobacterium maltaromaticum]MDT1944264.1 endolytic transglycosylase MltG [Carnobacterium maltaromaticum]MDT1998014.1 endolytic transglycosylase MltG [Carnobacterium maltaromaticum]TFJ26999.1 hypothetical protein CKN90_10115 [Carnobacterium maltaromaticum]TFJ31071.1 hypothetical protein CKN98_10125 [Carnobacterium maltaromaticum]
MNRPALRFLAVGFLVSALVLSGYRLFLYEPSTSTAKSSETAKKEKTLSADEKSYKEKYEELLTKVELEKVTGDSSSTDSSKTADDKKATDAAAAAAKKKADEEAAKKKAEEDKVKKYTLVIGQGDPTSAAVDQLASQGIIKDANEFTQFLSANDYEMYIRDGSYEVNSSMSYEQIAKIITHR